MKLTRLRGRKDNDYLRREGKLWRGHTMNIRYLKKAPYHAKVTTGIFVGTAASAKLHKSAVKRNRMRRRCREALRVAALEIDNFPTVQLLLTPRSSSLTCAYRDIETDVARFLAAIL